uniref:Uncharacterized protein n=1 Tax=Peronospora matthiolae TaxID=2874970 RepID=A0AAV1U9U4_9STRA
MQGIGFSALLACALAIAAAQDTNVGEQVGSMAADPSAAVIAPPDTTADPSGQVTSPPDTAAPGMAAPVVMDPAAAPVPPADTTPVTGAPGPIVAADPVPLVDSGSGSVGGTTDIATPMTREPKSDKDSSQSQSDSVTRSDDSSAAFATAAIGGWVLIGLLGLGTML